MNDGFSLIEVLLVIGILSLLSLLVMPLSSIAVAAEIPIDTEILEAQVTALYLRSKYEVNHLDNVYLNSIGNINHAQTLSFKGKKVVLHLGFGRFYVQ